MQILREHVMVRVGGGWDTLEHYLDKHDPCRCTSLCESLRPQTPWLCPVAGVTGGSVVGLTASGTVCRAGGFITVMPRCFAGERLVLGTLFGFGGH